MSLARVWMIPVQQQITEQFFRAGGLKAFEPALVVMDPEIAEELNSQHYSPPRALDQCIERLYPVWFFRQPVVRLISIG